MKWEHVAFPSPVGCHGGDRSRPFQRGPRKVARKVWWDGGPSSRHGWVSIETIMVTTGVPLFMENLNFGLKFLVHGIENWSLKIFELLLVIFFGQKYPWPWRSDLVSYGGSHPNFQDLNFPGMVCHWYITMANGKTAHLPSEVFTPKGPGTQNCRRFPIKASRFFLVWRSRFHHWPEGMRHRTGVQNLGILSPRYGEFTRKNDHQPLAFGNLFFKQHQLTFGHLMGSQGGVQLDWCVWPWAILSQPSAQTAGLGHVKVSGGRNAPNRIYLSYDIIYLLPLLSSLLTRFE